MVTNAARLVYETRNVDDVEVTGWFLSYSDTYDVPQLIEIDALYDASLSDLAEQLEGQECNFPEGSRIHVQDGYGDCLGWIWIDAGELYYREHADAA